MADNRIKRSSVTTTPACNKGIAPLNGQPTPVDPFCEDDVDENEQEADLEKDMNKKNFELQLSYKDVLEFLQNKHCLVSLLDDLQADSENLYNPPTQDEFLSKLNLAIKRENGIIDDNAIATPTARAKARVGKLSTFLSGYADATHKAFPIDTKKHVISAHAYIHKYWNDATKKGVTATYGRDDFVKVHKKIISAMAKFNIQHNYLDSLDNESGFEKGSDGIAVKKGHQQGKDAVKLSFNFSKNQAVVSWSRNRMRESGIIKAIDGVVATVQWECGLLTTEPLAGLFPKE